MRLRASALEFVMAGLVPAFPVFKRLALKKGVDARPEAGHDEV